MLTERQKLILQAIVIAYTETGHAVGSKKIVEMLDISISSATIRNEMAILENFGLIQKEHTSSGRIPSLNGYRFYVNHLKDHDISIAQTDLKMIKKSLGGNYAKVDEIISDSTQMLSELTSYTALAIKPETKDTKLSGFRLIPLGAHQVMAIMVTDNGDVESQQFTVTGDVGGEQLEAIVRLVNEQLVGQPIGVVLQRLLTDIPAKIKNYLKTPEGFLKTFGQVLNKVSTDQMFVGGQFNILDFSNANNPTAIKSLYELLNNKNDIQTMMKSNSNENQVSVKIGDEIANDLLKDYSLLTASYDVGDHGRGMIAILGPTRMSYSRTIGLLGAFRQELTNKLINYYQFYDD